MGLCGEKFNLTFLLGCVEGGWQSLVGNCKYWQCNLHLSTTWRSFTDTNIYTLIVSLETITINLNDKMVFESLT